MYEALTNPEMWGAFIKIAIINVVLSGDNAVVIALACRSLPPKQQRNAFIVGTGGIVVLMTVLTAFAAWLMTIPYLQLIGSVMLLWIGIKLLLPEDDDGNLESSSNFWEAVKTVIIADIIMSLDNVLGMAGAAKGHYGMLFLGLLITMPLILFGSAVLMKLMERFPVFVTIGAGLIGYVAGDMVIGDLSIKDYVEANLAFLDKYYIAGAAGALIVLTGGKLLGRKKESGAVVVEESASRSKQAQTS